MISTRRWPSSVWGKMKMKFTKMQALGNDYIYINCLNQVVDNPSKWAVFLSNRHYGVGSDGLVLILPSEKADFRMRMFNPDGTEAEICGNALRSVGKYVYDYGLTKESSLSIETLAGIRILELTVKNGLVSMISADMGIPVLEPLKIPVDFPGDAYVEQPLKVDGRVFMATAVSMGNPHVVAFIDDVDTFPLARYGPAMEHHKIFPKKVNAEFAQVIDRNTLKMRVWERSTGETLACGTGCCVSVVGGVLTGRCERKAVVRQIGGELYIDWDAGSGHIFLTGPSERVFDGEI